MIFCQRIDIDLMSDFQDPRAYLKNQEAICLHPIYSIVRICSVDVAWSRCIHSYKYVYNIGCIYLINRKPARKILKNVTSEQVLDVSGKANIQHAVTKVTFFNILRAGFRQLLNNSKLYTYSYQLTKGKYLVYHRKDY